MTSAAPPWKNGRHVNPTSSDVMPAASRIGPVPTQRPWVRSTPLGRPVVPDVYMIIIGSSAATSVAGTSAGQALSSSDR